MTETTKTPKVDTSGANQVLADIDRVLDAEPQPTGLVNGLDDELVLASTISTDKTPFEVTGVFGLPGFTELCVESGAGRVLEAAEPGQIRGASVMMSWVDEATGDDFTSHVDQYAVGLLHDIRVRKIRYGLRYVGRQAANGKWRAVRNYFRNGWLTEHGHPCLHNAGWGWSRKRSTRRADAACRAANATTEGKA